MREIEWPPNVVITLRVMNPVCSSHNGRSIEHCSGAGPIARAPAGAWTRPAARGANRVPACPESPRFITRSLGATLRIRIVRPIYRGIVHGRFVLWDSGLGD